MFFRNLLKSIMGANFINPWTKNKISFTSNGNPRNVKFSVVSLQQKENCFVDIGQWSCSVQDNETCKGNLTSSPSNVHNSRITKNFHGICGTLCPAGQYKIVDKEFASCCWKCKNCTGNGYSRKPGSSVCERCNYDEWPTDNHTACAKVEPQIVLFTENPAGIILLCVNVVSIKIVIALVILLIKYSQSTMKIFSHRILCYVLLFGILMCNLVAIFVLTNEHKHNCLLMVILSKLGSTCTLGTIFVKTNDVYRTYKKKMLRGRYHQYMMKINNIHCKEAVPRSAHLFTMTST